MADRAGHSVAGGWLGTYYYRGAGAGEPTRFEATLSLTGAEGAFGGTILDDGAGGEAFVRDGQQTGSNIRFVKVYTSTSIIYEHPIDYEGKLSAGGDTMSGTWVMQYRVPGRARRYAISGTWEARRLWHDRGGSLSRTEDRAETRERELVPAGR